VALLKKNSIIRISGSPKGPASPLFFSWHDRILILAVPSSCSDVQTFGTVPSYLADDFLLSPCPPHLHLTTSKVMVIVWKLRGNIIGTVLYIANVLPLQWAQLTKTVHTARLGWSLSSCVFLGCMICLYVGVCFVLPWTVESFPFMFWRWRNILKWAPFELFAPSPVLRVRSWLHPFKGHCEQKAMRDEGVIYVAGHPLQDSQGVYISQNVNYNFYKARYSLTVLKVPLNPNQ